jgi:hypothetical protein
MKLLLKIRLLLTLYKKRYLQYRRMEKLQNEELHDVYSSTNVFKVINSRRIRLAGYVAFRGVMKNMCKILGGRLEGKGSFGRPRYRWDEICGLASPGPGLGPAVGCCEYDNKPLGPIKGRDFLDQLNNYQLYKKASAP